MYMSIIRSIIKSIVLKAYKYYAEIKLSQLKKLEIQTVEKIANAIQDAMNNKLEPDEKKWIDKIENKRNILNNSSRKILRMDYGAGDPNDLRNEKEMNGGVDIETTVGEACYKGSKTYFWSLLLHKLTREFKPSICIELGTCVGISGLYQASALKLITLEGSKSLVNLANDNFQQLDLDNVQIICGRFIDNLDNVLNKNNPIDYVFIDGHHDEKATILYFEKFTHFLSKNSIIIFDDIYWSKGMRNAWNDIIKNELIKISINLREIGICILDENIHRKNNFIIPLFSSMALYND